MIHRIFGRSGYGKSEYLYENIRKTIEENPDGQFDIILIVPDQETVTIERKIADKFGNAANLRVESLNFSRMSNRISRKLGGMIYDYADSTIKKLVMNNTLKLLEPNLSFYGKVYDNTDFVDTMVRTMDELKLWMITPKMLDAASQGIQNKAETVDISRKISEISLIYASYTASFSENLQNIADEMAYVSDLLDRSYLADDNNGSSEKKYFFSDKYVFIDSFDSFTQGQKSVLERILRQAKEVYITLKVGITDEKIKTFEEENVFYRQLETSNFILEMCEKYSLKYADVNLSESRRFKNKIVEDLEKNLWQNNKLFDCSSEMFKDKLEIYECDTIFGEAETAAKKILYLTREKNYRYRDIKIVASDIASYSGILDSVFEKYEIPLFMSKRTKLSVKPLISMLLSLFDIAIYDFKLPNILGYIKNGLCNLDLDEIDDFELYITSWQLNGAYRYTKKDWNMHPDGYVEYSEDDEYIKSYLERINRIRMKFAAPIETFIDRIEQLTDENICTVKNITVAAINFLDSQKMYDRLTELQAEQQKNGDYTEASETAQIWNILMDLFQKISLVNGDAVIDLKKYSELLRFILDDIDISKIPTSLDEVTAQSANLMRDGNTKCTIILGVNSDIFPKAIIDDDLFNDSEKKLLKNYGIEFSNDCIQKSFDQLYYFYNAITSSSECAVLTYSKADAKGESLSPSMMIERICTMYPQLKIFKPQDFDSLDLFNIEGRENGLLEINFTENKPLKIALERYFDADADSTVKNANHGFKEQDIFIDKKMADKLFYNQTMSSTRLESYVNCHFGYFCNYVLKLKTPKRPNMQLTDIGKFIHKILELFMLKVKEEDLEFNRISDYFIKKTCEELVAEYLNSVIKDYEYKSDRFKYLLKRLDKIIFEIVKNLRDEFSSCDFVPADFELGINDSGEDSSIKPILIDIPGKGVMKITGIVDRVDTYKKGGDSYIRIVDYKTGSKKFNFSDILIGLNLQMLIYLFSVWHNGGDKYNKNADGKRDNRAVIPAGVLYMPSKISPYEKMPHMSDEDVEKAKDKNFTRSGLFLQDTEILTSMEHGLKGRFIPVNLDAESVSLRSAKGSSAILASLEQIGKLERYVTNTLSNIAAELGKGNASVKPFKGSKADSCAFCEMRSICRFEDSDAHRRIAPSLRKGEVWEIVEDMKK